VGGGRSHCGKRLKALLPVLIERMESHGHLQLGPVVRSALLNVSAATIDRLLHPMRAATERTPSRRWGIGTAIRQSIPVRTFDAWANRRQATVRPIWSNIVAPSMKAASCTVV
jgi:hypothetical protein